MRTLSQRRLLTFLGKTEYKPCFYTYRGMRSTYTRFVQTAIYELLKDDQPMDVVVFVTEEAKDINWHDSKSQYTGESLEGLAFAFRRIAPEAKVTTVDIASSQDEAANWHLFDAILQVIQEGDEIYFDITHSFRSIPLVALIVLNYARLIKKATIGKVVYGFFEQLGSPQEVDKLAPEERLAPLVDVTNMVTLLDWTNGVASFMRSGDTSFIQQLTEKQAADILSATRGKDEEAREMRNLSKRLHAFSQSLATCRGKGMHESIPRLKESLRQVRRLDEIEKFKPLGGLLDAIQGTISAFTGRSAIMDTVVAAKWCADHGLIQQGYTLIEENVYTAVCQAKGFDDQDRSRRELVAGCLNLMLQKVDQKRWKLRGEISNERQLEEMQSVIAFLEPYREKLRRFLQLSAWRNNINHAEMAQNDKLSYERLGRELKYIIAELEPFFHEMDRLSRQRSHE